MTQIHEEREITMMLSPQHLERLRDMLREKPLEAGEIRRIEWMGEQYIAKKDESVDAKDYTFLVTVKIDETDYVLYAKNNNNQAASAA